MLRRITAVVLLLVASTTLGCAMCAAPDDYTGPVPAAGFGFNDRAGSILQGVAPSDALINAEETQDAIGPSNSERVPPGPIQGQPTPAPYPGLSSRRTAPAADARFAVGDFRRGLVLSTLPRESVGVGYALVC
jgi:hypothetical protein